MITAREQICDDLVFHQHWNEVIYKDDKTIDDIFDLEIIDDILDCVLDQIMDQLNYDLRSSPPANHDNGT